MATMNSAWWILLVRERCWAAKHDLRNMVPGEAGGVVVRGHRRVTSKKRNRPCGNARLERGSREWRVQRPRPRGWFGVISGRVDGVRLRSYTLRSQSAVGGRERVC